MITALAVCRDTDASRGERESETPGWPASGMISALSP